MKEPEQLDFDQMNRVVNALGYFLIQSNNLYEPGQKIHTWIRPRRQVLVNQMATVIGPATPEDLDKLDIILGKPHDKYRKYTYRVMID